MQPILHYLEIKRYIEEYDYEAVLLMPPVLEAIKKYLGLQEWIAMSRVCRRTNGEFCVELSPFFGILECPLVDRYIPWPYSHTKAKYGLALGVLREHPISDRLAPFFMSPISGWNPAVILANGDALFMTASFLPVSIIGSYWPRYSARLRGDIDVAQYRVISQMCDRANLPLLNSPQL